MKRYFLEVSYKGTRYSGFQIQENANTIQAEIENALQTIYRVPFYLTGSSRTDAGVHAVQNYFHFDTEVELQSGVVYKLNSILPPDIAARNVFAMPPAAHSRFNAISRLYEYKVYRQKNPFYPEFGFLYPYKLDYDLLNKAAGIIKEQTNFYAFAKTNSQVNNYKCIISKSVWNFSGDGLNYEIRGNRFLRGMVRQLTGSMLQVGRGKLLMQDYIDLFKTEKQKCRASMPPQGLFLKSVEYPKNFFPLLA